MEKFPISYVILDIETSGLYPFDGDEILWVSAIKISEKSVVNEFFSFVKSDLRLSVLVTEITGVRNEMLISAPILVDVKSRLRKFISDSTLISHNSKFLDSFLIRNNDDEIFKSQVNLLDIARIIFPRKSCAVDNLLSNLGLKPVTNKSFANSVYNEYQIYEEIRRRMM